MNNRLAEIEHRDSVFPDIDPGLWFAGAKQTRSNAAASGDAPPAHGVLCKAPGPGTAISRTASEEAAKRVAADG